MSLFPSYSYAGKNAIYVNTLDMRKTCTYTIPKCNISNSDINNYFITLLKEMERYIMIETRYKEVD